VIQRISSRLYTNYPTGQTRQMFAFALESSSAMAVTTQNRRLTDWLSETFCWHWQSRWSIEQTLE
jgi:hypothetical protein